MKFLIFLTRTRHKKVSLKRGIPYSEGSLKRDYTVYYYFILTPLMSLNVSSTSSP